MDNVIDQIIQPFEEVSSFYYIIVFNLDTENGTACHILWQMLWQLTKLLASEILKNITSIDKAVPVQSCMHFNSKNFCCRSYEVNSHHMYDCFSIKRSGAADAFCIQKTFLLNAPFGGEVQEWKRKSECRGESRRGGQTTIHQTYRKKMKRTKCFHFFLPLHSVIYSTMFFHSVGRQKKWNENELIKLPFIR